MERDIKTKRKNNLQKTEIIQGEKICEVLYHQCSQKDNRKDIVSMKQLTASCKGKLRE